MFGAELPGMLALGPGDRVQDLLIDDWCLEAENGRGIPERRIAGNRECRKRGVTNAGQAQLGREVFLVARPLVDELSSEVRIPNLIRNVAGEDVRVGAEQTLHPDIRRIA